MYNLEFKMRTRKRNFKRDVIDEDEQIIVEDHSQISYQNSDENKLVQDDEG